ncbi:MAG TPA: DegV family protein [Streptosporangiaceae bacterium]|nr:DegV family protein [Streptosporangiaceae bacterium]
MADRDEEFFTGRSVAGLVAIVTDSTASLPADQACRRMVAVVPLRLLAGGLVADDGDAGAAAIEDAAERGERLTTARPPPERFAAAFQAAAAAGARAVVCVHVSGLMSGTLGSAELAAAGSPVPVRVVDARTIGTGLGLAVLAAARAAAGGQGPDEIAAGAARFAERTGSFFALDNPDALLASGRMPPSGRASPSGRESPSDRASPSGRTSGRGTAQDRLVARSILQVRSGQIVPVERVRTRAAAASRLLELAAGSAGGQPVDVAVEHIRAAGRAAELADRLAAVVPQVRRIYVVAAGLAIRAHTGPWMLAVTVAPHPAVG